MMRFVCLSILMILFFSEGAHAVPSISSTSGSTQHGGSVTISGSGFGTKSPVLPYMWADFEEGTLTAHPTLSRYPISGSSNVSITTVNPTAHSTYSVRGIPNHSVNGKQITRLEVDVGVGDMTTIWYEFVKVYWDHANWWDWNSPNVTGAKHARILEADCTVGGLNPTFIFDTSGSDPNRNRYLIQIEHSGPADGGTVSRWISGNPLPPVQSWYATEFQVDGGTLNAADGHYTWWNAGLISAQKINDFITFDDTHPGPLRCFDIQFFWTLEGDGDGPSPPDAYMHYDDFYVDNTWSRVMIGNASTFAASTIREIQIPTAWSDGSVTVTVNAGTFANGSQPYLYVIDSNGDVNATGFQVTIGSAISRSKVIGRTKVPGRIKVTR